MFEIRLEHALGNLIAANPSGDFYKLLKMHTAEAMGIYL